MTLDDAIRNINEAVDSHVRIKQIKAVTVEECIRAENQRQLAEWLKELKEFRLRELYSEDCVEAVTPIQKPKTGHWIKKEEFGGYSTILKDCYCDICGEKALLTRSYSMDGESIGFCPSNYCPNCGKKMEE